MLFTKWAKPPLPVIRLSDTCFAHLLQCIVAGKSGQCGSSFMAAPPVVIFSTASVYLTSIPQTPILQKEQVCLSLKPTMRVEDGSGGINFLIQTHTHKDHLTSDTKANSSLMGKK